MRLIEINKVFWTSRIPTYMGTTSRGIRFQTPVRLSWLPILVECGCPFQVSAAPYPFVVHFLLPSSKLQLENCCCIEVGWVRATAMNKITHLDASGRSRIGVGRIKLIKSHYSDSLCVIIKYMNRVSAKVLPYSACFMRNRLISSKERMGGGSERQGTYAPLCSV